MAPAAGAGVAFGAMHTPTAIITGASRGLGLALAHALARRDWRLLIDARSAEDLDAARAALAAHGGGVLAVAGAVADSWRRGTLAEAAGERSDLVVNNASLLGAAPLPALADYPLDVLEHVLRVNAIAPLALTQLALPRMPAGARIVNITADAAG